MLKKLSKKIVLLLIILILVVPAFCFAEENTVELYIPESQVSFEYKQNEQKQTADPPSINSRSAIIVEPTTGKILYEKNAHEKTYPASTTKILTALIVMEQCNLDDIATASYNAIGLVPDGYSNANIQQGEELSIRDLLYVLLIPSANEAANVLAEHVSGTIEDFAKLMNKRALELGCENSHFVNPNGIHDENHYTTAYDLYLIARECQKHEIFNLIVNTASYTLPKSNRYFLEDRTFTNTNSLILPNSKSYYYEFANGIKTGTTSQAGHCLVSSCSKDDLDLICVVLGGNNNSQGLDDRFIDSINLFNYVYNNYKIAEVANRYDTVSNYTIDKATKETENLNAIINTNIATIIPNSTKFSKDNYDIQIDRELVAPIHAGERLGSITIKLDGLNYTTDIFAGNEVKKQFNWALLIGIILGITIIAIVIIILNKKIYASKKQSKNTRGRKHRMNYGYKKR